MANVCLGWRLQATAVAAANGAPTLATDGVELDPHRNVSFLCAKTGVNGPYQLLLWFYRNGLWAPLGTPPWGAPLVGLTRSIQDDPPVLYPQRGYIELVQITAGDTFALWWGVEINDHAKAF